MQITTSPTPSAAASVELRVRAAVDNWRARFDIVGVSASVRRAGQAVADAASGVRALAGSAHAGALTPDDTLNIASITKTLAAALTLQLVERGAAHLAEPLSGWHPEVPLADRITLGNLLDHRSGIPGYVSTPEFSWARAHAPDVAWSHERAIATGLAQPRTTQPGGPSVYSNTNYLLIQDLLEQRTGTPFAQLLHERLVAPLGLPASDAFLLAPVGGAVARASGHRRDASGAPAPTDEMYVGGGLMRSVVGADGGAVATPHALAAIGESILSRSGRALSGDAHEALFGSADTTPGGYGLGVEKEQLTYGDGSQHAAYGHRGGIDGYASLLLHVPDSDTTVAIIANDDAAASHLGELAQQLTDIVATA